MKIPRAGQLNAKTLAEENLREFQLSRINKTRDINTNINSPQRIELPVYFNTPRRVEDGIVKNKISEKNQVIKSKFDLLSLLLILCRLAKEQCWTHDEL